MMNKKFVALCTLLSTLNYMGCDENTSNTAEQMECTTTCTNGTTCVDGKCLCGKKECDENQVCKDGTCEDKSVDPLDTCSNIDCTNGTTCIDGKCLCGNNECDENQVCEKNECIIPEPNTSCGGIECKDGEICIEDDCMCGNSICANDQKCVDSKCTGGDADTCNHCSATETCVDGQCLCGDDVCKDGELCNGNECIDTEGEEVIEEICPEDCKEGQHCEDNQCVDDDCYPACNDDEICQNHKCIKDEPVDNCNGSCNFSGGEKCTNGKCLCGGVVCGNDQECKSGKCENTDPCKDVKCTSGKTCVSGKCQTLAFNMDSLDVMMSTYSKILTVSNPNDHELKWKFVDETGKAVDSIGEWRLLCKRANKTRNYKYVTKSTDLTECIEKDSEKKTENIRFVGIGRSYHELKLKVTDKTNNETATVDILLKPYFGMENFINLKSKNVTSDKTIVYRNNYCPGNWLAGDENQNSTYNESKDNTKANLGSKNRFNKTDAKGNPLYPGNKRYSEKETEIIDQDMYQKYVRPMMIKKEGAYYGTRASVVAAARFLILQFPYDVPYNMAQLNQTDEARAHYIWTDHENLVKNEDDARIYGLNLNKFVYNKAHKAIKDPNKNNAKEEDNNKVVIPWGELYAETESTQKDDNKHPDKNKFRFNGLKCSGFVTWAMRNGRFGLGSFNSGMFANHGYCKNKDTGNTLRNFRCRRLVNNNDPDKSKNYYMIADKKIFWSKKGNSNQNNRYDEVFQKLDRLKTNDFVQLSTYYPNQKREVTKLPKINTKDNVVSLQAELTKKKIKAGDLLWRGQYIQKTGNNTKDGHIAMILGIEKETNGQIKTIYVAEAVSTAGNTLRKLIVSPNNYDKCEENDNCKDYFANSGWVKCTQGENGCDSYIIKMDRVYNYYSDKINGSDSISDKCAVDSPDNGNCYKYSDMWNNSYFTEAITRQTTDL